MDVETALAIQTAVRDRVGRVIVGHDEVVRLLMTALLCEGHVLLEGVPGTGKTLLVRTFTATAALEFKRIQFTPDMTPADIIGSNLFDFRSNTFTFVPGPVFTDFVLADEINRAPPKTQAALLEAMQERRVTVDGKPQRLSGNFMVVATQNPIEQEGTYPLPEAQLDRFLFKVQVGYPERDEECAMVRVHGHRTASPDVADFGVDAACGSEDLAAARRLVAQVRLSEEMVAYIVDLVRATRSDPALQVGASPRSANMLASAARAYAVLEGRDFVIPDDVKTLFDPTLRHRVVLAPGAELEGAEGREVLNRILDRIPAPR
ncbi:MAG: MoxR family ATPase [Planctomyces sp.]|nr:MoxR family ATPase [Planctomyces sp.]